MAFPTKDTFAFDFEAQSDYPNWTPDQTKENLNKRSEEIRIALNAIANILNSVTDSSSGADNTAMTPITSIGVQSSVQGIIEALVTRLQSVVAGSSGAKFVGVETISGLAGNDAQTILIALKTYVDAYKTLLATTAGAGLVGVTAPTGLSGSTVQDIVNALKTEINNVILGQIADDSLTDAKLSNTAGQLKDRLLFEVAGGTATAITISAPEIDGYAKTFIASASNSGSATTINAKSVYKPGGTTAPTFVESKAYTVWWSTSDDCFFLKASATGTATTAQVLAGVPYSNDTDTDLVGTMINNVGSATVITPSTADQVIPQGYFGGDGGDGKVLGSGNLAAFNIRSGVNIFGVVGTAKQVDVRVVTSSASTAAFTTSAGATVNYNYVDVQALLFAPAYIFVIKSSDFQEFTSYTGFIAGGVPCTNTGGQYIKVNVASCVIDSSSYVLPVGTLASTSFICIAVQS